MGASQRLGYKFDSRIHGPDQTADQFWAEYDRKQKGVATQPVSADHGP
jgi:hypothetical protein